MKLSVVVLAAGKGRRMMSDRPKVMHCIGGVPLLQRVVETSKQLSPDNIYVVHNNSRGIVNKSLAHLPVTWIDQKEQLGTGHAVLQVLPECDDNERLLILNGDVPLVNIETLKALIERTPFDSVGLVVARVQDPTGLGRISRNDQRDVVEIIEEKDASKEQQKIDEINSGIVLCPAKNMRQWLRELKPHNQQGEYYLTDIVGLAVRDRVHIEDVMVRNQNEVQGVNDLWQLTELERCYQRAQAKALALSGVAIMDPSRLDIRGNDVQVAADVTLDVNVILEGRVSIGKGSVVEANCFIKDSHIGENVIIKTHSVIEGSTIENHSQIGPFARIRPDCQLGEHTKVGNFVEMKKTQLGAGSKASHLSYIGDSTIGEAVNIGAGTITCNYDGHNKWQTVIHNGAFIGSNTALVAPVVIGENATIGAGSTINQNAPAGQLTLARARQQIIADWQAPQAKPKEN